MSKERLEEIKNSHLRGIHSLFGTPWVSMPKENFDWLIEQAERVEELEKVEYALQETYRQEREYNKKLEQQNKRYRETLKFYADEESWSIYDNHGRTAIGMDGGQKARKALEE